MNTIRNAIREEPAASPQSAKNMAKPVNFFYSNRSAKSVSLIGEFNHWNPLTHPMRRREDGWWLVAVPLPHGHHQYLFMVDGVPTLDPQSSGTVYIKPHSKASVIAVS
jgi:1,4-alpha-glucan branching enzyme